MLTYDIHCYQNFKNIYRLPYNFLFVDSLKRLFYFTFLFFITDITESSILRKVGSSWDVQIIIVGSLKV